MAQFLLPDLGEGLEEAQLVQWLVREGDRVELNQPICQVETAKAMVDIPSPFAGTIQALHAQPGDTVPVGAPLITIAEVGATSRPSAPNGEPSRPLSSDGGSGAGPVLVGYGTEGPAQSYSRRRRQAGTTNAPAASVASPTASPTQATGYRVQTIAASASAVLAPSGEPTATPLVRKIARERGVDLRAIHGTGPRGRIRLEDLEHAFARSSAATSPKAAPRTLAPDEERISTVGLRKAIAARMVRSATTIPQFTEYGLFDATALVALRARLKSDPTYTGTHLTYLPFFIRALVRGIAAYPIMNARWDEEDNAVIVKHRVHVGIATDTKRGLLVPVIADAQEKSLAELAQTSAELVERARAGTLDATLLTGGTITLTNVGAAGPVETGSPLINPPEVCIVGLGAIKPRPTVVGDKLEVRPGAWISMSCDHRVVDGATAAQFLAAVATALEQADKLV